jgi:hypothetical protein
MKQVLIIWSALHRPRSIMMKKTCNCMKIQNILFKQSTINQYMCTSLNYLFWMAVWIVRNELKGKTSLLRHSPECESLKLVSSLRVADGQYDGSIAASVFYQSMSFRSFDNRLWFHRPDVKLLRTMKRCRWTNEPFCFFDCRRHRHRFLPYFVDLRLQRVKFTRHKRIVVWHDTLLIGMSMQFWTSKDEWFLISFF